MRTHHVVIPTARTHAIPRDKSPSDQCTPKPTKKASVVWGGVIKISEVGDASPAGVGANRVTPRFWVRSPPEMICPNRYRLPAASNLRFVISLPAGTPATMSATGVPVSLPSAPPWNLSMLEAPLQPP